MTSLPSLEARVAHVEGIVEEMRNRFASIEARLSSLESRLDRLENRLTALEGRIQSNFQRMAGLLFPMGSLLSSPLY
jgi:uncharacterized coiled-coil protein SlyX